MRNLTYTASGDVKEDTREDGSLYSYTYDQAGRLEYLADEDLTNPQIVGTYHYDYRDLRVRRQLANGLVSLFVFLADGRLLGEYDGSTGEVIQEYIWLGDRLVGQVDGAGTLRSVLTGHLGQPLRIMSTTADVLWDGEMDPFGQYHAQWGSEVEPLQRLPGQWYERGAGLVQNWHRSYDPTLGRYLQADPIGLAGGQSVYGYAYQNPMSYVDPDGLIFDTIWDAANVAYSSGSAAYYGITGDYERAGDELINLGLDVGAMCIPGVPAGASAARRMSRAPNRSVDKPKKPKKGCTAICRADANDNIPDNIRPGDKTFAFGEATASSCPQAVKIAKRRATQNLGKQPKHVKCRTSG